MSLIHLKAVSPEPATQRSVVSSQAPPLGLPLQPEEVGGDCLGTPPLLWLGSPPRLAPGFRPRIRDTAVLSREAPGSLASAALAAQRQLHWWNRRVSGPQGKSVGEGACDPGWTPGLEAGRAGDQGYSGDAGDLREGPVCCGPGCVQIWTAAAWCFLPAF